MKIVFFDVDPWSKPHIKKAFPDATFVDDRLSSDNAAEYKDAEIVSTFHTSDLSHEVIEALPHLKMIATRSTGYNHIDVAAASKKHIISANVPTYGKHTVAEHAFGLILTLTRHLFPAIERVKREGKFNIIGLQGEDLFGKTIGIIGLGEIGECVLKIAKGFNMEPLVYTRTHNEDLAHELGFEYAKDLEDLLKRSDVITLHLPLTEHTTHIINTNNVHDIKKGAYLINTARGGLIDTDALLIGLEEGILAGVGLDVLEDEFELQEEADLLSSEIRKKIDYENLVMDHVLMHHDKVVITPHNAFNTSEARLRILQTSFDNIHAFLDGKPKNIVS